MSNVTISVYANGSLAGQMEFANFEEALNEFHNIEDSWDQEIADIYDLEEALNAIEGMNGTGIFYSIS